MMVCQQPVSSLPLLAHYRSPLFLLKVHTQCELRDNYRLILSIQDQEIVQICEHM